MRHRIQRGSSKHVVLTSARSKSTGNGGELSSRTSWLAIAVGSPIHDARFRSGDPVSGGSNAVCPWRLANNSDPFSRAIDIAHFMEEGFPV